jgi:hypothetical protein
MLTQHLANPSSSVRRLRVGLEVAVGDVEDVVELVRGEFVGGEDAEVVRVALDDVLEVLADGAHAAVGRGKREKSQKKVRGHLLNVDVLPTSTVVHGDEGEGNTTHLISSLSFS